MADPSSSIFLDSDTGAMEPASLPSRGRALAWVGTTFAGLTWQIVAVAFALIFVYAIGRPSVRIALVSGEDYVSAAMQAFAFSLMRFTPGIVCVIAAINRAPDSKWARIAWIGVAVVAGEVIGLLINAATLPLIAPHGYFASIIDLDAAPLTQVAHWAGIALSEVAIIAMAIAFWYAFERKADVQNSIHDTLRSSEHARQDLAESRLAMLQAQIEPHFLFNTLASIRRLYETDRGAGRSMLRSLSEYLHASLPTLRATRATLGTELALATAYLNVQKIRMGARLTVVVDVSPKLLDIEMPAMILPTLAENAVVHGIGPMVHGGTITIRAVAHGHWLRIEVSDDGRGLTDDWGAGVGLANINARLHETYGAHAGVSLVARPDRGVKATVDLPIPAQQARGDDPHRGQA